MSQQFRHPVSADHFHIIIKQQQIFTFCLIHSKIVDRRIVKLFFPVYDTYLVIANLIIIKKLQMMQNIYAYFNGALNYIQR